MRDGKSINNFTPRRVEGTFLASLTETLAGFCVHSVLKEAELGPRAQAYARSAAHCPALITETSLKVSSGCSEFSSLGGSRSRCVADCFAFR